jgi:hypothetical protein
MTTNGIVLIKYNVGRKVYVSAILLYGDFK